MKTYKNVTVDKLANNGCCVACGGKLTKEDKVGGFIRCGVCREDLKRHVTNLREERRKAGLCLTCGQPKLPVSPYCHECGLGGPEKKFDDDDVDSWIEYFDELLVTHPRLFVRLHDPERRASDDDKVEEPGS